MAKDRTPFEGITILVVEDNPINQMVTKDSLENLGCLVDAVSSGSEALKLVKQNTYRIIMMDIRMPDMDGFETTRRIREIQDRSNPPVIIALTANALPEDREKCLNAGMDDYIAKPLFPNTLRDILEKHLSS